MLAARFSPLSRLPWLEGSYYRQPPLQGGEFSPTSLKVGAGLTKHAGLAPALQEGHLNAEPVSWGPCGCVPCEERVA